MSLDRESYDINAAEAKLAKDGQNPPSPSAFSYRIELERNLFLHV